MTRANVTLEAGLRGSNLLSRLREIHEGLASGQAADGDLSGDEDRAGMIYVDTTSGAQATKQSLGAPDFAMLWHFGASPFAFIPKLVTDADSPYSPTPSRNSVLLCDAASGPIEVRLDNFPLGNGGEHLRVIKTDTTTNAVTITTASPGYLPAEGGYFGASADIVLRKSGDRVHLAQTSQAEKPDDWKWYLVSARINSQRTITFADTPYAVQAFDDLILVDASAGNVVVTLPSANVGQAGRNGITVKNIADNAGANTVTVNPQGGEQIDALGAGTGLVLPAVAAGICPSRTFERGDAGTQWWLTRAVG